MAHDTDKFTASAKKMTKEQDVIELPSGIEMDLFAVDVSRCKTSEDAWELGQCLQEKIIEIDFQLECYGLGYHHNGTLLSPFNHPGPLWEPRAKKALAWSKLQKSDAQYRFQKLSKAERAGEERERRRERGEAFIDAARRTVPEAVFHKIMEAARLLQNDDRANANGG